MGARVESGDAVGLVSVVSAFKRALVGAALGLALVAVGILLFSASHHYFSGDLVIALPAGHDEACLERAGVVFARESSYSRAMIRERAGVVFRAVDHNLDFVVRPAIPHREGAFAAGAQWHRETPDLLVAQLAAALAAYVRTIEGACGNLTVSCNSDDPRFDCALFEAWN